MDPYQPITKERAAEILSVSKRTINTLLANGILPRPIYIGRRMYWHPDAFFTWLDGRLHAADIPKRLPDTKPLARQRGRPRKSGQWSDRGTSGSQSPQAIGASGPAPAPPVRGDSPGRKPRPEGAG